jgi:hypothetical protein
MLTFLGSGEDGLSQLLIQDHASWLDSVGDTDRIGIAIIVSGKRNPNAINAGILRGLFFSARNVCLIVYRRACSKNKPGGSEYGCSLFHRPHQSSSRFMKALNRRLVQAIYRQLHLAGQTPPDDQRFVEQGVGMSSGRARHASRHGRIHLEGDVSGDLTRHANDGELCARLDDGFDQAAC